MATKKKTTAAPAAGDTVTLADGSIVPVAAVEHITPDLRPLAVPIDSLTPDPRNARTHGDKNRAAIAKSLQQNGQLKPISVDANGVILAGNGTWAEAKALGWQYIARARTALTGAAAMRWALQDNRTAELAEWDQAELERQTDELAAELDGFDLGDIGFDEGQLEALLNGDVKKAHGFAPAPPPKDPPAGEQKYPSVFKIIITCTDERHQAELIKEFEGRGYQFTAPNVT
ncbi:MAG TPA: ParB N-terminal domain-containing protein [Tepidisphaeraceae bacterium]|jgi:hypothetical protein|nr:ParB N-terminal domain-containing protein [Tepidisphaeraceae bacterium]